MTEHLPWLSAPADGPTPRRLFLSTIARRRIDLVAQLRDALQRAPVSLVAAYSFKTNPRAELVALARDAGFFAETISADELRAAADAGFARAQTIYNGPAPLPEHLADEPLAFAFADSLEAFLRNVQRAATGVHGVRLRPSMISSRFGVPVDEDPELRTAIAATSEETPLGISFHVRREDFNGATWSEVADDVLDRARAIERETGHQVVAFDVGGGWTPDEFDDVFYEDVSRLADRIARSLPACTRLIFEPGQAVCTPTEALLTAVTEVRRRGPRQEVIVDLAYSDWPQMHEYRHGLFAWRGRRWQPVGRGPDRLGGRTCLEYDRIEGLRLPADISPGDRLLVADVGAYDHSMAFTFARGDVPAN